MSKNFKRAASTSSMFSDYIVIGIGTVGLSGQAGRWTSRRV